MIEIFIFHLHIVAAVFIFVKYWQSGRIRDGFMGLALFVLLFSIGWPMMTFLVNLFYPDSWKTVWFNNDTLALIFLLIPEIYFFRNFFCKSGA
jgi:membrane-bound metal-dependent hydrolase YbcI (DUF457 family)